MKQHLKPKVLDLKALRLLEVYAKNKLFIYISTIHTNKSIKKILFWIISIYLSINSSIYLIEDGFRGKELVKTIIFQLASIVTFSQKYFKILSLTKNTWRQISLFFTMLLVILWLSYFRIAETRQKGSSTKVLFIC